MRLRAQRFAPSRACAPAIFGAAQFCCRCRKTKGSFIGSVFTSEVLFVEIAFLLPGQERCVDLGGRVQYDYCSERGEFFSCVAKTLDAAHELCEDWLMRRERH